MLNWGWGSVRCVSAYCVKLVCRVNLCWDTACPEEADSQGHHAAQNIKGLEINQASVSQLKSRNIV